MNNTHKILINLCDDMRDACFTRFRDDLDNKLEDNIRWVLENNLTVSLTNLLQQTAEQKEIVGEQHKREVQS